MEQGGDIVLLRPMGKARELLVMLHLDRTFRIFDGETEATAAFGRAP